MDASFEQKVREKAYQIWQSAGMAEGMANEHWLKAEQAVANETGAPVKAKKAPAVKKAAVAKVAVAKVAVVKAKAPKAAKPASELRH